MECIILEFWSWLLGELGEILKKSEFIPSGNFAEYFHLHYAERKVKNALLYQKKLVLPPNELFKD